MMYLRDRRYPKALQISILISFLLFALLFPLRGMSGLTLPFLGFKLVDNYTVHVAFILAFPVVLYTYYLHRPSKGFAICTLGSLALIWISTFVYNQIVDLPAEDVNGVNIRGFQYGAAYYALVYTVSGFLTVAYGILERSRLIISFFSVYSLLVLFFVDYSALHVNFNTVDDEFSGSYLLVADLYAVLALASVFSVKNAFLRIAIMIFSSFILYALYSRTSFFAYLIVIFLVNLIGIRSKRSFYSVVMFGAIFLIASLYLSAASDELSDNRMFSFILTGQDGSVYERILQFDIGISRLYDNWFFGDYGGQVISFGRIGAYMHNVLSYWQQYGLVVFWLIISSMIYLVKLSVSLSKEMSDRARMYGSIIFFCVIVSLLSRSYVHYLIWFSMGIGVFFIKNDTSGGKAYQ